MSDKRLPGVCFPADPILATGVRRKAGNRAECRTQQIADAGLSTTPLPQTWSAGPYPHHPRPLPFSRASSAAARIPLPA